MSFSDDTAEFMFTGHPTMGELQNQRSKDESTTKIPYCECGHTQSRHWLTSAKYICMDCPCLNYKAMKELRKDQSVEDYLFPLAPPPPTILDIAKARGVEEDENGGINGAEFARVGLPLMGGCQVCNATIAAYNAYPGINGYLVGSCCVEEVEVFETIAAFENWMGEEE